MYGPEINNDECTADVGPFGFMGCTTKGCACEIKQAKHEAMVKDLNTTNFKTKAMHESMRAIGWMSPEEITAVVEKNLQAYKEALAEANETTRVWKKRYTDLSTHINTVNTQNAELAATVELSKKYAMLSTAMMMTVIRSTESDCLVLVKDLQQVVDKGKELLRATPTQCLRQIQADAGRAGFVAGAKYVYTSRELGYFPDVLELVSLDYVERVKAGEV